MCGRFTLTKAADVVAELFELDEVPSLEPRYNIAPTQSVPAVRRLKDAAQRQLAMLHWGLIPFWAKDRDIGSRLINARAETLSEKPSFRNALKSRRCLIVADGFYEWKKLDEGKQPYYIRLRDGRPFAFAGLWERWNDPAEGAVESCTIITTEPNELMKTLHNRMPVILPQNAGDRWLDPKSDGDKSLSELLIPYDADQMEAYPVSRRVNNPKNDVPACIERAGTS
jgi:putative SOS response-associated peptidase YedK